MRHSIIWFKKSLPISNQICLYCGVPVGAGSIVESNEEHMVGRNFVPKGTMENAFNFSFRACKECNHDKSRLEDHVSGFTLLNTPSVETNEKARKAAERKALNSIHPQKRIRMGDAHERQEIEFSFGSATFKFGLIGQSRPAEDYIPQLAYYHIQALFSLVTTVENPATAAIRILPPDQFRFFDYYLHSDWGNPQLNEFARRAAEVPCLATISTGADHFRACLRRCADKGWLWALEWNKSIRIIGAICQPDEPCHWFEDMPALDWKILPDGSRIRRENTEPDLGSILFPEELEPHPFPPA